MTRLTLHIVGPKSLVTRLPVSVSCQKSGDHTYPDSNSRRKVWWPDLFDLLFSQQVWWPDFLLVYHVTSPVIVFIQIQIAAKKVRWPDLFDLLLSQKVWWPDFFQWSCTCHQTGLVTRLIFSFMVQKVWWPDLSKSWVPESQVTWLFQQFFISYISSFLFNTFEFFI